VHATGIDMTREMLDVLRAKHPDKKMTLRCESYFDADLGEAAFDGAISFESLHHFTPEAKLALYRKLCAALKPGAVFIDGDKMAATAEDEAESFAGRAAAVARFGLDPAKFYHYDTPLTPEHETALLLEAGFARVEQIFREATVTVLAAYK
jgi:tRNA (cmo5U34)-methyltransferase